MDDSERIKANQTIVAGMFFAMRSKRSNAKYHSEGLSRAYDQALARHRLALRMEEKAAIYDWEREVEG